MKIERFIEFDQEMAISFSETCFPPLLKKYMFIEEYLENTDKMIRK